MNCLILGEMLVHMEASDRGHADAIRSTLHPSHDSTDSLHGDVHEIGDVYEMCIFSKMIKLTL